jgi:heme/copper-type cytochrome/quinol oxidase subunit 2
MPFRPADAIFWVAVACCVVAQVAIIRSAVISPARPTDSSTPTTGARRTGEIAWAVLPGLALVVLFFYTWNAIHPAVVQTIGLPIR